MHVHIHAQDLNLIPKAQKVEYTGEIFQVPVVFNIINYKTAWHEAVKLFEEDLMKQFHYISYPGIKISKSTVYIKEDATLSPESYILVITQKQIQISNSDVRGLNYAFATLKQLLLQNPKELPTLRIEDHPDYSYRGVMIDCARHFWTKEELKKSIDQMSLFKLNILHLHLTDNQGWRFEVKKYPQLTEKGTYFWDFPVLSGKYYTQEDLKEIIAYAGTRGIEVIPEIDMPGHMLSLLAAFPELSCLDDIKLEAFPQERLHKTNTWQNMVCLGNPKTYEILEDIIEEVCKVFPSKYVHLGGDEVATMLWKECPQCKKLYDKKDMHDWLELQDHFTHWAHDQLAKRGKTMIGWDEINTRKAVSHDNVMMRWIPTEELLQHAQDNNIQVITCPGDPCYFDYGYAKNPTRKVYEWSILPTDMNPKYKSLFLGSQVNLWSEYICNQNDLEKMIYPRVCALAENLWNASTKKDWHAFYQRLQNFPFQELGIHAYLGEKEGDNWFHVVKGQKPTLPSGVHVETNIYNVEGYDPEYALDGNPETFFQNGWATDASEYFKVLYDTPKRLSKIRVLSDLSKDYYQRAKLFISEDDSIFTEVGESDDFGNFEIALDGRKIRSFKIIASFEKMSRLVIREIETEEFDFSVLNWNIWQEGTMIKGGYESIVNELKRLTPDLVTFTEVRNYKDDFLARLCNDLKKYGLEYYSVRSEDSGLISRFPIKEHQTIWGLKEDHGTVYKILVEVPDQNGKMHEIAVYSTHMDYLNDTYYEIRGYDGNKWEEIEPLTNVEEILRRNAISMRDEECQSFLEACKEDREKGRAIILGGDFNEPSFLDWTEATKDIRDHRGTIVPWPQSESLYHNYFEDSFRSIYPDPVKFPGFTYPCNNPEAPLKSLTWAPKADERERIDFLYHSAHNLQVLTAKIVGPSGEILRGERAKGINTSYNILPSSTWPSDHKALFCTYKFN